MQSNGMHCMCWAVEFFDEIHCYIYIYIFLDVIYNYDYCCCCCLATTERLFRLIYCVHQLICYECYALGTETAISWIITVVISMAVQSKLYKTVRFIYCCTPLQRSNLFSTQCVCWFHRLCEQIQFCFGLFA